MRKHAVVVIAAALIGLVSFRAVAAAPTLERTGIGESILLVVADITDPSRAEARARTLNARFGALSGFAVDSTDGYDLRAALVQSSPDVVVVKCPAIGNVFQKTVSSEMLTLECRTDVARVDVQRPVVLQYVPRSSLASFAWPDPCGGVGLPPCQKERLMQLFGDDLRMPLRRALIASGFRTKAGAEEFIALARTFGVTDLVTIQAYKLGGRSIGLGQEAHPDGSGPLEGPLPDQDAHQR